jgi:hypothetical protein
MTEVSSCVICDGRIRKLKDALVAPFLAHRIWNREPFCVDLVECRSCGFMFYNPRLDEEELGREYAEFRTPNYFAMRNSFEPWYSAKMNVGLGSPESYEERRALIRGLIAPIIAGRSVRRVLEFGGDRGDLALGLIDHAQAYVYDISGVNPAPGVIGVSEPKSFEADLVLNSNVLEHVGFPRKIVASILAVTAKGGLAFIEVPCELPFGAYRLTRRLAQVAMATLLRPTVGFKMVRPSALYLMHEHINYFTERSLTTLVSGSGATILASGVYPHKSAAGRADMGWCLAVAS